MLSDGFFETNAVIPIEILRGGGVNVKIVGIYKYNVIGDAHISIKADILLNELKIEELEMIILPGGYEYSTGIREKEKKDGDFYRLLRYANIAKIPIVAIGTAPIILEEMGFLRGKNVVCYPNFEEYLIGTTIIDKPFVIDGNIITVRGSAFVLNASFKLLEMLKSKEIVKKVKENMLYDTK